MSNLNKARMHSVNTDGSIGEDLDVYTSGEAVTLNDGKTLENIYVNDIGKASELNTQNKIIVGAINENAYNIESLGADLSESVNILTPTTGSTENAILLNITTLINNKKYSFKADSTSTGNVTINGKAFKKLDGTQIGNGGIKASKVYDFYYDSTADCVFILAKAEGNATVADVLAPKRFSNGDDIDLVGTIPSKTAQTYKPTTTDQIIPAGQYLSENQTIKGYSDLLAENIVKNKVIGDVIGTLDTSLLIPGTDHVLYTNTGSYTTNRATPQLEFSVACTKAHGTVEISFVLTLSTADIHKFGCAQIYVNGVQRGTLRTVTYYSNTGTFVEDITINEGDIIQMYTYGYDSTCSHSLTNFKICCGNFLATFTSA